MRWHRMPDDATTAALLELVKNLQHEMRHQRALLLESLDQGRAMERVMDAQLLALQQRVRELKEELERTIKGEMAMLVAGLEVGGPGR